jgi:hypothetical protein
MKNVKFYFVLGNEKTGNVSTGEYDKKGDLILTGEMPRDIAIAQGRIFTYFSNSKKKFVKLL